MKWINGMDYPPIKVATFDPGVTTNVDHPSSSAGIVTHSQADINTCPSCKI